MKEIKPCPFCGCTEIKFTVRKSYHENWARLVLCCTECAAEMNYDFHLLDNDFNLEEAQHKLTCTWNTRVNNQ